MGFDKVYWSTTLSGRATLDNDIHDSRCAIVQLLTWLCDDPLPDVKTRVVMDRWTDVRADKRTDGQTDKIAQVIAVTYALR